MFEITTSKEIPSESKVLAPISMKSKYFTTEKFKALINFLKSYNATLLIADSLQRHNMGANLIAAKKLGASLLSKCHKSLANAVTINNIKDWEQYKNENILKIIHWDTWGLIKQQELTESILFIETLDKEDPAFNQSIELVAETIVQKQSQIPQNIDKEKIKSNSINYQKEELAYMLTFSEFDFHLYPEINQSQSFIYDQFKVKFLIPENISFKIKPNLEMRFINTQTNIMQSSSFISLAGRQVLMLCQGYLNSSEVSPHEKKLVLDQLLEVYQNNVLENPTLSKITNS